jgi:hypothetical protein
MDVLRQGRAELEAIEGKEPHVLPLSAGMRPTEVPDAASG